MRDITQEMIDGLDKTTEEGFAEALMICLSALQDRHGLLVRVRLSDSFADDVEYSRQIARRMLHKGESK